MVIGKATYSPQDDKIRIYFNQRIDKALWEQFKEKGFTWTMKQESDLVATWTVARGDFAVLHCGQIENEISDRLDRSADRAERFSGYLENRIADTEKNLDNVEAIGMESKDKAEKIATRVERMRDKSNLNYSKAKYWHSRIESVIAHAEFKECPELRKRRIRTLKSDIIKHEKAVKNYQERLIKYKSISEEDFIKLGLKFSDGRQATQTEAIEKMQNACEYGHHARWYEHLKFRIDFEERVLKSQGYTKLEADYKIGGIINGLHEIVRINKTKGEINSFTVKFKKRDKVVDAIILIENVESYEPPASDFKPRKKDTPIPILNLSKEKLYQIFGETIEVLEFTAEEWKNKSKYDTYGFEKIKDSKIIPRYQSRTAPADYKLRGVYQSFFEKGKQKLITLVDKKYNDEKVPVCHE